MDNAQIKRASTLLDDMSRLDNLKTMVRVDNNTVKLELPFTTSVNMPFTFAHLNLLESLIANPKHSCQITYRQELADRFSAWIEQNASTDTNVTKHTLADVVNEITRVGHAGNVQIHEQLKLERIGGAVLEKLIAV